MKKCTEMPEIVRRFFEFHSKQPEVYEAIKDKAKIIMNNTSRSVSFAMIYETARFEFFVEKNEDEVYKMNNDYRAGYLRLLIKDFPMYAGQIETRYSVFDSFIN